MIKYTESKGNDKKKKPQLSGIGLGKNIHSFSGIVVCLFKVSGRFTGINFYALKIF